MFASAAHYVFFLIWRLCRADKDRLFGEFRTMSILLVVEVLLVASLMDVILQASSLELGNVAFGAVLLLVIGLTVWYYSNEKKRAEYQQKFRAYSVKKRLVADVATISACGAALTLVVLRLL